MHRRRWMRWCTGIKHMNPRAPQRRVHFGEVPIAEVFDLRGFNLNAKLEIDPEFLNADGHGHDHHGHHEHDHDHEHGEQLRPSAPPSATTTTSSPSCSVRSGP